MAVKITRDAAIAHLDHVLMLRGCFEKSADFVGVLKTDQLTEILVSYRHALARCCPPAGVHAGAAVSILRRLDGSYATEPIDFIVELEGVLRALRSDWAADRLDTFQEMVRAELFSDMLEAAAYLADEGYHGPAAVMAGAVLEQHIRKLCDKNDVPTTTTKDSKTLPKKLEAMNAELANYYAGGKQDQKEVTTLAGLRNHAAHGEFDKFDERQVDLMIQSIRGFLSRNPA